MAIIAKTLMTYILLYGKLFSEKGKPSLDASSTRADSDSCRKSHAGYCTPTSKEGLLSQSSIYILLSDVAVHWKTTQTLYLHYSSMLNPIRGFCKGASQVCITVPPVPTMLQPHTKRANGRARCTNIRKTPSSLTLPVSKGL